MNLFHHHCNIQLSKQLMYTFTVKLYIMFFNRLSPFKIISSKWLPGMEVFDAPAMKHVI